MFAFWALNELHPRYRILLWAALHTRGVATGVYRYIYPPKISPRKMFMGYFFFFLWGRASTGTASWSYWNYNLQDFLL